MEDRNLAERTEGSGRKTQSAFLRFSLLKLSNTIPLLWDINTLSNICHRLVLGLSQFIQDLCLQKTDDHHRLSQLQALHLITCSGLNTNFKNV